MEFKASHILRSLILLLLCCTFFISKGKSIAPAYKNTTISKVTSSADVMANPLVKFHTFVRAQAAIRLAHKNSNPFFSAFLLPQSITTACVRCFNFFSGYNNHRYKLRNVDFLFPFHGFW
jgi:hypothetical protein